MKKIIAFIAFFLLYSCTSNTYQEIELETNSPTYENNIKPILVSNCVSCHNPTGISSFLLLTNLDQVKTAIQSNDLIYRIETATGSESMPLNGPKLSASRIELIKLWAVNGFPN